MARRKVEYIPPEYLPVTEPLIVKWNYNIPETAELMLTINVNAMVLTSRTEAYKDTLDGAKINQIQESISRINDAWEKIKSSVRTRLKNHGAEKLLCHIKQQEQTTNERNQTTDES